MIAEFVHPLTKEPFVADAQGDLRAADVVVRLVESCYDFARLCDMTEDRVYYDEHYHHCREPLDPNLSVESVRRLWECDSSFLLFYNCLGGLCGKTVLLLGNGKSLKELRFASEGADVVYSDISLQAVLGVKKAYEHSMLARQSNGQTEFHAIDALHLPFKDETFDIIYGCAFVHHIQNLSGFLHEVHRCLKTGGKCIFLDAPYSPAWQCAKATILRPLQIFSHWRSGISPEDRLATQKGGYRRDELQGMVTRNGFKSLTYRRTMFLEHLVRRGATKLLTRSLGHMFAPMGRFVDRQLLGPRWVEKHGLHLVWGYSK
jgi:ubiquinone/menaquinone biosynthesis C-methylase UbiE